MRIVFPGLVAAFSLGCGAAPAFAQPRSEAQPVTAEAEDDEATADRVVAATAADLRPGAEIRDVEGGLVGRIQSADRDSAIVTTGRTRARLPLSSFGKNRTGLVISMSRSELEAAAAAQSGS